MNTYDHLPLPVHQADVQRQTRGGGGGYKLPEGRDKRSFSQEVTQKADDILNTFQSVKSKFTGNINPSLIFEIEVNQGVNPDSFEAILSSMGIRILSVAENKKGYWIVFSDDENLGKFKNKLNTYASEKGPKYDFFNAISSLRDIPKEEKIGKSLQEKPLGCSPEFIDIELWRMVDKQRNETFINKLKQAYSNLNNDFRITDTLITKSFVLLRVKLTKAVFDEVIELKEIARAERPPVPTFNPFEYRNVDVSELTISAPDENAVGILIIDSGIISNHPMLEKCVGGEDNFQSVEEHTQDTVGHGTSVAGCVAYGDVEKCIEDKNFNSSNWVFSAKLMYAERNPVDGTLSAIYDPEKLVEHQFKDAVESFISNPAYHIRVVNISLGNSNEVWHKDYKRQLPLAALIDELAYTYPAVTFIVSTGNQHPQHVYSSIQEIIDNYPKYFLENSEFKIVNPATSALALTVGSIAGAERVQQTIYGNEQIRTPIAKENQPSPFMRSGLGINGMLKPELVEYGGNTILINNHGSIQDDTGGKIALLNNHVTQDIIRFDYGTSYSAPKVAHLAGKICNKFPRRSANFVNNMLLVGTDYPFIPDDSFYGSIPGKAIEDHMVVCGYGLSEYDRAVSSFDNRTVLFDEGQIGLNKLKVYSLQLPEIFFREQGRKKIIVTLTFNPETRGSRGDSYLGNRMEFHLFHSVNPQVLIEKYGLISADTEKQGVPEELKSFEISLIPGANTRKAGCHQKAWKDYKRQPKKVPSSISLALLNINKWINDENRIQDYCLSVTFEHEKEIELYNAIRASIQARARVR